MDKKEKKEEEYRNREREEETRKSKGKHHVGGCFRHAPEKAGQEGDRRQGDVEKEKDRREEKMAMMMMQKR